MLIMFLRTFSRYFKLRSCSEAIPVSLSSHDCKVGTVSSILTLLYITKILVITLGIWNMIVFYLCKSLLESISIIVIRTSAFLLCCCFSVAKITKTLVDQSCLHTTIVWDNSLVWYPMRWEMCSVFPLFAEDKHIYLHVKDQAKW